MKRSIAILSLPLLLLATALRAEPYIAVGTGIKCIACHTNPTGGGKRTAFGSVYAQTMLSVRQPAPTWDGRVNERLALGGDLRANINYESVPDQNDELAFDLEETLLYVEVNLLPDRLTFYVDQMIAPGSANNRESWALYWLRRNTLYLKAGRMFLPYGLRLEDDSAFIRQVPGINYTTPDTGVELGLELQGWSINLALSNGTAGGGEADRGKQISAMATYVTPGWRLGSSLNFNDTGDGDRSMVNIFAGLKTGPVAWLAEIDAIADHTREDDEREQLASLLEANWVPRKGHNLKLTYEFLAPDSGLDDDERTRISGVWEYFPLQFTQIRAGVRDNDGPAEENRQNTTELFLQLHNYF